MKSSLSYCVKARIHRLPVRSWVAQNKSPAPACSHNPPELAQVRRIQCLPLWFSGSATRSEEHTSELQSLMRISYAVFCLKKKKKQEKNTTYTINSKHNEEMYKQDTYTLQ